MEIPHSLPPRDPLGQALHLLRMEGMFYCHSELTAPWAVEMPVMPGFAMFHVVVQGVGRVETPQGASCVLGPGGFALVPRGEGHVICDAPGQRAARLFDLEREELTERYERLSYGGDGAPTTMICGALSFQHPMARRMLESMPSLLHVDTWEGPEAGWVDSALAMMEHEARTQRPGGDALLTRLADIFVIQALRRWLDHDPRARTGWLGACQDPQVGVALARIHEAPEQDWTVATLAREASMSRSAFAERFRERVGATPSKYLTRWRMELAWERLRATPEVTIAEVADALGYRSEAAFGRAFKRCLGVSPGQARRATEVAPTAL